MIDTLSLLLAHLLLAFVAVKMLLNPDLNVEPVKTGRHFKQIAPKRTAPPNRAGVERGDPRPGDPRA